MSNIHKLLWYTTLVIADSSKLCGDSCDLSSTICDLVSDGDYICVCQNKFVPIDGTKATCAS